jgi:hypothetical protein
MAGGPNASRLEWIRDLQFDPNHPSNTELTELLRVSVNTVDSEPPLVFYQNKPKDVLLIQNTLWLPWIRIRKQLEG